MHRLVSDCARGDAQLFQAAGEGDADALRRLIDRHDRWVRGVVFGVLGDAHLVDDVTQDVWVAVWRKGGQLSDSERWRHWLYRLARNVALDRRRHGRRWRRCLERLWSRGSEAVPPNPAERAERADEDAWVLASVSALPEIYRAVIVLRHIESWSYREIAEALGAPVETIETRLTRARGMLREKLKRCRERNR